MKIGYFADGPWSHKALFKLLEDETIEVSFICARNDNPDIELARIANEHLIDFITHPKVNSSEFISQLDLYQSDLFVSMSFNQIFRKELINLPPKKTINCHAGKLPFYRGRNVLNWVLINDEHEYGITVHYVDEGIDTGDIILQKTYPISDADDYSTLLERSYSECARLLYEAIKLIQNDEADRIPQINIHPTGFYCTARRVGDELLNWHSTSREVFNFVRSVCRPGPEARTFLENREIRINRAELIQSAPIYKGVPGAVLFVDSQSFLVKTLDSYIRVIDWTSDIKLRVGDRFK